MTFPSNDEARISDVKNALARGEIPDQKIIERSCAMLDSREPRPKHSWPGDMGALSLRDAEDVDAALNALKNLKFKPGEK